MHLFDAATRFYGGNAIVGGGLPLAVGLALADKLAGRERVTACFFGDGAVAEGEFHESMNLAARLAPAGAVLLREQPLRDGHRDRALRVGDRPGAEGRRATRCPSWSVDGMDVLAVEDAARKAADRGSRLADRPCFLELRTYRFRAHSMYDPDLYRTKEEIERWKQHDPISGLTDRLRGAGVLSDEDVEAIEGAVAEEIEAAIAFAEAGTLEPVEDLERFVYWEGSVHMSAQHRAGDHLPRGDARGDPGGAARR